MYNIPLEVVILKFEDVYKEYLLFVSKQQKNKVLRSFSIILMQIF